MKGTTTRAWLSRQARPEQVRKHRMDLCHGEAFGEQHLDKFRCAGRAVRSPDDRILLLVSMVSVAGPGNMNPELCGRKRMRILPPKYPARRTPKRNLVAVVPASPLEPAFALTMLSPEDGGCPLALTGLGPAAFLTVAPVVHAAPVQLVRLRAGPSSLRPEPLVPASERRKWLQTNRRRCRRLWWRCDP